MTDSNRLTLAKQLVSALEQNNEDQANFVLEELSGIRESQLFHEVGCLTRQLHDSMKGFTLDSKLSSFTESEIPDAKERLNYVVSMTEQAANQTLSVVEDLFPVAESLNQEAQKLSENWERFLVKKMPFEEFKAMTQEITDYFNESTSVLAKIHKGLNDILMAQGFQDITGQVIRKVITLVEELENNMVELIKVTGGRVSEETKATKEPELPGPNVPGVDDKAGDVATSQDDVDDLLSSLGF